MKNDMPSQNTPERENFVSMELQWIFKDRITLLPYGLDELYLHRVGAQLLGLELISVHTSDYVIGSLSQSALSKISRLAEASLLFSHWPANERQGNIEISYR